MAPAAGDFPGFSAIAARAGKPGARAIRNWPFRGESASRASVRCPPPTDEKRIFIPRDKRGVFDIVRGIRDFPADFEIFERRGFFFHVGDVPEFFETADKRIVRFIAGMIRCNLRAINERLTGFSGIRRGFVSVCVSFEIFARAGGIWD